MECLGGRTQCVVKTARRIFCLFATKVAIDGRSVRQSAIEVDALAPNFFYLRNNCL